MYLINLQSAVSLFNLSLRPLRFKKKADLLQQFSTRIANNFSTLDAKSPILFEGFANANSAIRQKA